MASGNSQAWVASTSGSQSELDDLAGDGSDGEDEGGDELITMELQRQGSRQRRQERWQQQSEPRLTQQQQQSGGKEGPDMPEELQDHQQVNHQRCWRKGTNACGSTAVCLLETKLLLQLPFSCNRHSLAFACACCRKRWPGSSLDGRCSLDTVLDSPDLTSLLHQTSAFRWPALPRQRATRKQPGGRPLSPLTSAMSS